MSLVFKDVCIMKRKLSKKVVQYGNIQFCAVPCLPSQRLFKRRVLKRQNQKAITRGKRDVQDLQRALSTELDAAAAAANLSTTEQDSRTPPHSVNSKSDDIDKIFSAIL